MIKTAKTPLLWDGGVGSGLIDRGLDLQVAAPEDWLLARPAAVRAVHAEFAAAGADVLQTNSFGLLRLWQEGRLPGELPALVAAAVRLAREGAAASTAPQPPEVIASLGPSGRRGELDAAALDTIAAGSATLAALFRAEGVRALHLETSYSAPELRAMARGVRTGAPDMELICSVTLTVGNSGLETPLGTPLAVMLRALGDVQPDVVGVNCSQHARRMVPAVEALRAWAGPDLPVLAQPQVGNPGAPCRGPQPIEGAEVFCQGALRLLSAGADAIGGCCGCRGEHLWALRKTTNQDGP